MKKSTSFGSPSSRTRARRGPALRSALALGLGLAAACGGSSPAGSTGSDSDEGEVAVGKTLLKPSEGSLATYFVVDQNRGGKASNFQLVRMFYGRQVDVYQTVVEGGTTERRLVFEDFVVGEDITTDGVFYEVETNPVTQETSLTILAENDLTDDNDDFDKLLREAENRVRPVGDKGPNDLAPFPLVARNSALVLQFDDALDHDSINRQTIRVLVGSPSEEPFEARIVPDPSHGTLLRDADGAFRFHSTRVIVDFTVSQVESEALAEPLTLNSLGLPASSTTSQSNVLLRIPTVIDFADGVFSRLENVAGHPLSTDVANQPVDFTLGSKPVIRAMRSGNVEDANGGFLRDLRPPQIVGEQTITVETAGADTSPGARPGFDFVADLQFNSVQCALRPEVDDILDLPGGFFQVTAEGNSPIGGLVEGVRLRALQILGNEASDLLGGGIYLSTFDPSKDRETCFVSFVPGAAQPPASGVDPLTEIRVRFSEPMDPKSVTAFDSFMIVTDTGEPLPTEVVAGRITASSDLQTFTYTPAVPFPHTEGTAEQYSFAMGMGKQAAADLSGNEVENLLPNVQFNLANSAASNTTGSYVLRFGVRDEDQNAELDLETGEATITRPEIKGQFLYNLDRGVIRPRPVSRFRAVADRNHPVTTLMNQFPGGVQTPLSPLGSRLMHVWRYCDFNFALRDESLYNIDVEGLAWAPVNGQVVADSYENFRIRLAHSNRQPDERLGDTSNLPDYRDSGLKKGPFEQVGKFGNILEDPFNQLTVVHPKEKGYEVDPADVFTSESGTKLMPYPMNRDPDAEEHYYYTWRDTQILAKGAPDGVGADLHVLVTANLISEEGVGSPYREEFVPSVGLPLLMEYSCYPSNSGVGLNSFDVSLAINSSGQPNFRLFATGGVDSTDTEVVKDPDTEDKATGGFNPNNGGNKTKGFDVVFYHGSMDVVVRVSRVLTIWIAGIEPELGKDWYTPIVEPRGEEQPNGTQVLLAFRGASEIGFAPDSSGELNRFDGNTYDMYGNPVNTAVNWGTFIDPVVYFGEQGEAWSSQIDDLDGANYIQVRLTMIGNPVSNLTPEVSAIGIPFEVLD